MDPAAIHARRWWTLGALNLTLLLIVMDNTIVNIALPTIQEDLGASISELQWIVDAYILVFAGLLLTAGSLGDKYGRKKALDLGLVIMALACLASAFASGSDQLIATRAVMGIGGALVMPATLSILMQVFKDPRERAKAIALWSATAGAAASLGPMAGGWLLEHFWWGSVFLVNIPVVVIALVAGRFLIPNSRDPDAPPVDVHGSILSFLALIALVWAIIEAGKDGFLTAPVIAGLAVAAGFGAHFLRWERSTSDPMLDLGLFRNPRFSAASTSIVIMFFTLFGLMFVVTQFLSYVMGYDPFQTGLAYVPMALGMMFVSTVSAAIVERVGTKVVVVTGMGLVGLALLWLSRLEATSSYWDLLPAMLLTSASMGLIMPSATESIMGSLPLEKAGVGSAVNDATREVGGALGVAVFGSVLAAGYSSALDTSALPPEAAAGAEAHLGGAVAIGGSIGGEVGQALIESAQNAYVDGMRPAFLLAAGVVLAGAIAVARYLPARASEPLEELEGPTDEMLLSGESA